MVFVVCMLWLPGVNGFMVSLKCERSGFDLWLSLTSNFIRWYSTEKMVLWSASGVRDLGLISG